MASLADNVARAIKVFDTLKAKVTNYVGIGSGNVSIPGSNIDTNHNISIETYVNAIDEVHAYGIADGRQAQYDEIRDIMQDYGNRTDYSHFLSNPSYIIPWYKPKYDMRPTTLYMFQFGGNTNILDDIDFVEWFNEAGVVFDTSECTDFQYALNKGLRYGVIDTRATTRLDIQVFYGADKLHTIDELIIKEDGTTKFHFYTFANCSSLKNLKITGTIGNSITFYSCPLSKDSILSVFNALSPMAEGMTLTLKKTAVNTAFGIDVDDTTTYSDEWRSLTESKKNWNIAYA